MFSLRVPLLGVDELTLGVEAGIPCGWTTANIGSI
jgi:hypothetical protein